MKRNAVEIIAGIVGLVILAVVAFIVVGNLSSKNNKTKPTRTTKTTKTTNTRTTTNQSSTTKKPDPLPSFDYVITYNLDGGTNNPNNPSGFNSGETITLLNPSKLGYDFEGWYTSESYSGQPVTEITIDTDYELFAKFAIHKYTITYYNISDSDNPNPSFYTINDSIITLLDVDKYSATFKGWYTTSTFDAESKITEIDPTTLKDYELYAEFEIIKTDPIVNVQAKNLTYNAQEQELLNVNVTGGTIYYSLDNENFTTEMPKGLNAGTYTIYYKVIGDDYHFDVLDQSIQVTIGKATYDMSNVEFDDKEVTYNGDAQSIIVTGTLPEGVTVSYENNGKTNVGIYEIIAKFSGDLVNYYAIADIPATLTINKAVYDMSNVEFSNKSVTYNGDAQSITISGTLPTGVSVSYENNEGTNVGTYDAIAIFNGDFDNYEAISNMNATLTITKATYDMSGIEFNNKSVTYNGETQSITISGTLPEGVSVTYENNDKVNAGTYTVTAKFTGDSNNYELISNMTATLTINKAVYDMSQITFDDDTVVYDGTSHSIIISGTLPTGVTVEYENNGKTNVGTYTIVAGFSGDATNYELIDDMTATLIISKNAYDMSGIEFNNKSVTYNGSSYSIEIIGELPEGVSVSYENNGKTNAGTYTIIAKFVGDATNYELIPNKTAVLTINKATYDMSGVTFEDKTVTYNGSVQSLAITGTLPTGVTVEYENNDKTNAGTYEVVAKFTGDSTNYELISDMTATLVINKATYDMSDIEFNDTAVTYDGSSKSILISGTLPTGVTVSYEGNNKINFGTYTITAKFSGDTANYELISDMTATLTINKAVYDMSGITFIGDDVTYDGNIHSLVINGTLPTGVTVEYENNDKVNVGTYTVIAVFTSNNPNYEVIDNMTATLIINKATAEYTLPTGIDNLIYNENAQALVNAGSVSDGSIEYSLDGETWSTTIPTATTPNTYTVSYRFVLTDNYEAIDGGQIVVEIDKATIDMSGIELNDKTATYTGSSQSIAITGTLNPNVTVNYTGEGINVGTYTITATFTVDTTLYYEIDDLTATLTITPATIKNVTVTGYSAILDHNAHNIVVSKSATTVDNCEMTWLFSIDQENWLDEITVTNPEDSGTYYFKISADNHNDYIGHFEVVVTEKNVTTIEITNLSSLNKVYDGTRITTPIINTNNGLGAVTISYSLDGTTFTETMPINAGHYTIKVEVSETETYAKASIQKTFDISKATYDMSGVIFEGFAAVYDGGSFSVVVSGTLPAGVTVTYEGNNQTNVGTYTVTAKFSGDYENYNEIADMTTTFEIIKATYIMSGVSFNGDEVTYDGNVHSLAITGTLPEGVTVSYENNGKTIVGTYTVTAKFAGDTTNYNDIDDMTATLTITKATYDMSGVTFNDSTIPYDGLSHKLTITGTLPTGVTVTYSDTTSYTAVGTYEYTASFSGDTTNYELIDDMTATLTIEKASIDTSVVEFNDLTVTYDGTAKSITASNIPDHISVEYSGNGKTIAGTYTVTVTFLYDEDCYTVTQASKTATLTIEKASIDTSVVEFNDLTVTYDGANKSIIATNIPSNVTVEYTGNGQKNAGTYTVTATFVYDSDNYTVTVASKTATLTIEKATIYMSGVVFENKTVTYDGNAQSIIATNLPSEITSVNYTNNGKINAGTYTITASFVYDTDNYNEVADMTATLTINKRVIDNSNIDLPDATFTYDGSVKSLVYTGTLPAEIVGVYYNGNDKTNVGEYDVILTFNYDMTNYTVSVLQIYGVLTIEKATIDMSGITFNDATYTYDGSLKTITISGSLPVQITGVNYTDNEGINAGTYSAVASFAYDTDNYNIVSNMTATLTINKKEIDTSVVVFNNLTVNYDNTAKSITATNLPTGVTVNYTNNNQTNAGTYTVTATFVYDSDNCTVTVASKTATLTINKINPTYTVPTNLTAYVGQTLNDVTLPARFTWNDPTTTSVGPEGSNTFLVTYTPADTTNYNTINNIEVTITVTEASVYAIICANNQSTTYNALEQCPTVTVKLNDEVVTNNYTLSYAYKLTSSSTYTDGLPTNAGTYNIKINCSGSEGSNAEEVIVTFTINKAKLTVTTTSVTLDYSSEVRTWAQIQEAIPTINVTDLIGEDTTTVSVVGMHNGKYKYGTVSGDYTAPTSDPIFGSSYNNVVGSTYLLFISQNNTNYELNDYQIVFKYKTAKISSTFYTIEDALGATGTITFVGDSTSAQTYVATTFSSLPTSITGYSTSYTVSSRTLIVPYDSSTTDHTNNGGGAVSGNVYTALVVPSGITLNFTSSSTLTVASEIGASGGGKSTASTIHGVLVNNGTINIASGCKVNAYGFVKGIGTINLASGSTLLESMCIFDWVGGTAAATGDGSIFSPSGQIIGNAFVTNSYIVNNTSCDVVINSGATLTVFAMIYAGNTNNPAEASLIVPSSSSSSNYLFKPTSTSGKITKKCNGASSACSITSNNQLVDYNSIFEIEGNWNDGIVKISVYKTIETGTTIPIPIGLMNIIIKSGSTLNISKTDFTFLPGSSLVIEEGATLNVTNSEVDFTFTTVSQITGFGGDRCFTKANYSKIHEDAYLLCNGTFNCAGSFGGKIITTVENATIKFTSKLTSSSVIMISTTNPRYKSFNASANFNLYSNGSVSSESVVVSSKGTYYSIKDGNNNYGFYTSSGEITYNLNGGQGSYSPKAISISSSGYTITSSDLPSTNPSRNHYTFDGWYLDSNFETLALGYTTYCGVELIAKWNLINYSIEYKDVYDGGFASGDTSTSTNPTSFNYETNIILADASNGEYVFGGWYVDSSCTTRISTIDGSSLVSYLNGNKVTLYALWYNTGTNRYVITYINDNENITCPASESIVDLSTYSLPVMTAKDKDYTTPIYFGGWYNGTTQITTLDESLFTLNPSTNIYELTLTASWLDKTALEIEVGAFGVIMTVYYISNFEFTIPSLESKGIKLGSSGLVLINWQLNDGNTYYSGDVLNLTTQTHLTANIVGFGTLSISKNDYTTVTVTLTSNAGYTVNYDATTGISSATPFTGATKTNGDSLFITIGSQFKAKYAAKSGSKNNGASITGTTPTTALATSDQTYTASASEIIITVSGEEDQGTCLLPTTEIMLADGTIKQAKDITKDDLIITFNHITGQFEEHYISFNVIVDYSWFTTIELTFENGKVLKFISGHGLFNMDKNKYVIYYGNEFIDHIGETFATVDYIDGEFIISGSKLISVVIATEYAKIFSPLSEYNINCVADGILTVPDDIEGMFDGFIFNDDLTIDMDEFMNDIELYGVFEYEEVKNIIPEYVFDVFNFKYFKTFILKGVLTVEQVNHWIEAYIPAVIEQNNLDYDFDNREILTESYL